MIKTVVAEAETETSVELSVRHRRADALLAQVIVANEMKLVSQLMTHSRDTSPYVVTLPKKIRFLSKFGVGIFATVTKKAHLGKWDEMHYKIASENGAVIDNPQTKLTERNYISADYFILRGFPQVTLLKLGVTWLLKKGDIELLEDKGYLVLDHEYNWVIANPKEQSGYSIVPSQINRDQDWLLSVEKYLQERT